MSPAKRRIENAEKETGLISALPYNLLDIEQKEKEEGKTRKRKCQRKTQFEMIVWLIHGDLVVSDLE